MKWNENKRTEYTNHIAHRENENSFEKSNQYTSADFHSFTFESLIIYTHTHNLSLFCCCVYKLGRIRSRTITHIHIHGMYILRYTSTSTSTSMHTHTHTRRESERQIEMEMHGYMATNLTVPTEHRCKNENVHESKREWNGWTKRDAFVCTNERDSDTDEKKTQHEMTIEREHKWKRRSIFSSVFLNSASTPARIVSYEPTTERLDSFDSFPFVHMPERAREKNNTQFSYRE